MFKRRYIFNPGPFSIAMLVYWSVATDSYPLNYWIPRYDMCQLFQATGVTDQSPECPGVNLNESSIFQPVIFQPVSFIGLVSIFSTIEGLFQSSHQWFSANMLVWERGVASKMKNDLRQKWSWNISPSIPLPCIALAWPLTNHHLFRSGPPSTFIMV